MDRQTAIRQFNLSFLQCKVCKNSYPAYRMLIGKIKQQHFLEDSSINNDHQQNDKKTDNQLNSAFQQQQQIQYKIPRPPYPSKSKKIPYYCIQCFTHNNILITQLHKQTYQQLANRYISQIPLPQYNIAQQCLALAKQIQKKSNMIIKEIVQNIDQFKFFILKLVKNVEKVCGEYLENVRYMGELRIQERFILEQMCMNKLQNNNGKDNNNFQQKLKKSFYYNQNQRLFELTKKYCQLSQIKQKVETIKLTTPNFNQSTINLKRKRIFTSKIPISSITTFNSKYYFGMADGNIVFPNIKSFSLTNTVTNTLIQSSLVSHKAHESLVRSFSNDDQYTLYSGSDDFTIKAWDVRDGQLKLIRVFGTVGQIRSYHRNICVVENGKSMVSTRGQFDGFKLRIWQLQQQYTNTKILNGHESFIRAMTVIDKQKNLIITGSEDKKIKIWSIYQSKTLHTIHRNRKCVNLIICYKHQYCCIIEQQGKVTIIDLFNYSPILAITLPRSVQVSCGYSKYYQRQIENDNDYIVLGMINNIGIWRWDLVKIWNFQMGVTYTPIHCMQLSNRLIISDGSGAIQQVLIGNIQQIQQEFYKKLSVL